MLKIEFETPNVSTCKCCGGQTTSLTRFVYRKNDAHAVYYASFSDNHLDRLVDVVVSLGEWGDNSTPAQRRAFALTIRASDTQYVVTLVDAKQCPWRDTELIGRVLDREQALADPWIKMVFHVTDHIVTEDIPVKRYLGGRAA